MGGLLPDWSYNSGGISKPSDVAHHWDEVSIRYEMPIDGDVWLEDPLHSSYPPSIAFKAAQIQDEHKAFLFLRLIREMVFLHKINIAKPDNLLDAAGRAGLDVEQFNRDTEDAAKKLFQEDLALAKAFGVRGFPTFFFQDQNGQTERVYGTRPYDVFEDALLKILPSATRKTYSTKWEHLFGKYPSYTAKEFAAVANISKTEAENVLDGLFAQSLLHKLMTKNGALWTLARKS
jgi:predicted DsbA family dithiol-disulfide isomerase